MKLGLMVAYFLTALAPFYAYAASDVNIETSAWKVSVGAPINCTDCISGQRLTIQVEGASYGNTQLESAIDGNVSSISEFRLMDSVLTVVGELPFGGQAVSIFDLENQLKVTEFYGYNLHFSDDNRYIIYRKYFPRMMDKNESLIMLFDMMEIFEQDRSFLEGRHPQDIGIPIYPSQERSKVDSPQYTSVPSFSLSQVLFNDNVNEAVFSGLDENENITMIRIPLWHAGFTSSLEVCSIPLIERELQTDAYSRTVNNTVEKIELGQNSNVIVSLYDTRGVSTVFSVNLEEACRSIR